MIAHREAAEFAEQLIADAIDKQNIVPGTLTLQLIATFLCCRHSAISLRTAMRILCGLARKVITSVTKIS
jgi:hypothetical protein